MSKWRPEGWWGMVESPYMHDGVKMAKEDPERALELEWEHEAFRKGQEAGADAMLESICEEIEKVGVIKGIKLVDAVYFYGGLSNREHSITKAVAQAQLDEILTLLRSEKEVEMDTKLEKSQGIAKPVYDIILSHIFPGGKAVDGRIVLEGDHHAIAFEIQAELRRLGYRLSKEND